MSEEVETLSKRYPHRVSHTSFFDPNSSTLVQGGPKLKPMDEKRDSQVLIVGASFSGADIAVNMTQRNGLTVTAAYRKPQYVVPRLIDGLPMDAVFYRRTRDELARSVYASSGQHALRRKFPTQAAPKPPAPDYTAKHAAVRDICESTWKRIPSLEVRHPNVREPPFITVSDGYLKAADCGALQLIPSGVASISVEVAKEDTGRGDPTEAHPWDVDGVRGVNVTFQNGQTKRFDHVMFATGYITTLGYLDSEVLREIEYKDTDLLQPLILYRGVLCEKYPTAAWVGLYRGPFFAVMELQARWAMETFSGRCHRPDAEAFREGLEYEREVRGREPRPQFPHGEYVSYCDILAAEIGADIETAERKQEERKQCHALHEDHLFDEDILFHCPVFPQTYLLAEDEDEVRHKALATIRSNLLQLGWAPNDSASPTTKSSGHHQRHQ